MEECSVLIETTKSAEDKTSRWFDLPIDYELFRDLLGVEADSDDYQITDRKLPFADDIVRTTSVRRLSKLYFAYMDLPPEVQQSYKDCRIKSKGLLSYKLRTASLNITLNVFHSIFSYLEESVQNFYLNQLKNILLSVGLLDIHIVR